METSYAIYHLNKINRLNFFTGLGKHISDKVEQRAVAASKRTHESHPAILEHLGHGEIYHDNIEKAVRLFIPEDRYDRFIDEHTAELRERFGWAAEKAMGLFLSLGRIAEAVKLTQELYIRFPKDNTMARAYINVLVTSGDKGKALEIYSDFKNRLWREHRLKPSFDFRG